MHVGGEIELYNFPTDPGEQNNLVTQKPDIVQELTARIKPWTDTLPASDEYGEVKEN